MSKKTAVIPTSKYTGSNQEYLETVQALKAALKNGGVVCLPAGIAVVVMEDD